MFEAVLKPRAHVAGKTGPARPQGLSPRCVGVAFSYFTVYGRNVNLAAHRDAAAQIRLLDNIWPQLEPVLESVAQ